jgi:chloride channel protein, CIC family
VRFTAWARAIVPAGAGFESSRRLAKWLVFGTAIGIVAGLGAILFFGALEGATRALLGFFAAYVPPGPAGEGGSPVTPAGRPWALPVITTLGGLAAGALVFGLAPEAEGHGTDAAIDAIHRKNSVIRARVVPIKLIASAITIGSGGSAGREGPAAQISAGFGSLLGRWFLSDPRDRRIAVAAGIGAGIGAIFKAPLGGALLAAEILYVHDIEVEAIIPSLIASIVGYTVFGAWAGFGPIFGMHPSLVLGPPIQLVYYGVLGIVSGLGGLLYARSFYATARWFERLHLPRWVKPGLGGLAVGLMGIALPQIIHTGYGWAQLVMTRQGLLSLSPLVLLLVPFGKILATSLSIGSGGSGGIFGPGVVIGGMFGALLWRVLFGFAPGLPSDPAPFVIIGMMALFGGIAHAPLAVMLMVAEMTGTLSLLAPAMIAVAISTAVVGDRTIYSAQLLDRSRSPHHRVRLSFPMLATLHVRDAIESVPTLEANVAVADALERLREEGVRAAAVVDEAGRPLGAVERDSLERAAANGGGTLASVALPLVVDADQTLEEALVASAQAGVHIAAVANANRIAGIVTSKGILATYRRVADRRAAPLHSPA